MRRRVCLLAAAAVVCGVVGRAEAAGSAMKWTAVEMSMKPRGDDASPAWTVRVQAGGAGEYSESGAAAASTMPLRVSASTMERLQQGERAAKSGRCETHVKNIANSGEKTIRFVTAERTMECTFNYSDDAGLMDSVAAFQAIAETMKQGERLQHDLRYDRLGLDADMEALLADKQRGGAIEIGNIAPVLQALVEDDHVIDRVRRKAARLLQDAGATVPAEFTSSER